MICKFSSPRLASRLLRTKKRGGVEMGCASTRKGGRVKKATENELLFWLSPLPPSPLFPLLLHELHFLFSPLPPSLPISVSAASQRCRRKNERT